MISYSRERELLNRPYKSKGKGESKRKDPPKMSKKFRKRLQTALYYTADMLGHEEVIVNGEEDEIRTWKSSMNHVEKPERIHGPFMDLLFCLDPMLSTEKDHLLVHGKSVVELLKNKLSQELLNEFNKRFRDVYMCRHSERAARLAAGGAIACMKAVMDGKVANAFALVRPPGHHATQTAPMGFCLLNNVAIAAERAFKDYPETCKRILIVDWDVHHGNGIQDAFYGRDDVCYVSLHRFESATFFPNLADAGMGYLGKGAGLGKNINIPWSEAGMGDADYIHAFTHIILPIAYEYAPDLILVAAGFDAGQNDPIGNCNVSPAGFAHLTHMLSGLAGGKLVLVLEGGYNVATIRESVVACIRVMMGEAAPLLKRNKGVCASTIEVVEDVQRGLAPYWKCMRPHHIPWTNSLIAFTECVRAWYDVKWGDSMGLKGFHHAEFMVHFKYSKNRTDTCVFILQNVDMRPLLSGNKSKHVIVDTMTPLVQHLDKKDFDVVHIAIEDRFEYTHLASTLCDLKSLIATCRSTNVALVMLDTPTKYTDKVCGTMNMCLTPKEKKVSFVCCVTSEDTPDILSTTFSSFLHWFSKNGLIYENSAAKIDTNVIINDDNSVSSDSEDSTPAPPRRSYGSQTIPIPHANLLALAPYITKLCVQRKAAALKNTAVPVPSKKRRMIVEDSSSSRSSEESEEGFQEDSSQDDTKSEIEDSVAEDTGLEDEDGYEEVDSSEPSMNELAPTIASVATADVVLNVDAAELVPEKGLGIDNINPLENIVAVVANCIPLSDLLPSENEAPPVKVDVLIEENKEEKIHEEVEEVEIPATKRFRLAATSSDLDIPLASDLDLHNGDWEKPEQADLGLLRGYLEQTEMVNIASKSTIVDIPFYQSSFIQLSSSHSSP